MTADKPVSIERTLGYQLRSMGLIQYVQQGNTVLPACKLYQLYFSK
jgi:AAA-like domain